MKQTALSLIALLIACTATARAQDTLTITSAGSRPSRAGPGPNMTGTVRVEDLFDTTSTMRTYGSSVAFDPGARTRWHTHPRGQVLIVIAGTGRVQVWGAAVREIRPGDVVQIPAGVKHWHGAAPTSPMTHIAMVESERGRGVEWLEAVTDAQYGTPVGQDATLHAPSSRAQQVMGDIAPKLAQLTDSVLFGDVWARPGLSRRDRSLATVSALVAMNRPDQLRSHLALARTNGVTQEEIVEAITHLAFYAGWPSAVSAVAVAREVFGATGR